MPSGCLLRVSQWERCIGTIRAIGNLSILSRITSLIRHVFVWSCALLAIGVAVSWVRSYWRCDEAGYYSFKPTPPPSAGRDYRNLIGSCRGGLFWVCTEADIARVDWYGGEPTEFILNTSPSPQLASAALEMGGGSAFQPIPRWSRGGFNLEVGSGQVSSRRWSAGNRWWYRGVVVPHWAPFLLLAWAPALRLRHRSILRQWRKRGLCLNCGYDVRASGEFCSECGSSLRRIDPGASAPRPWRRGRWAAAGVPAAGMVVIWWCVYGRGERSEPVVRLSPATMLPTGQLPRQIELEMGGGVSMRLVLIPSGRFLMGSPPNEANRVKDETQHEVIISKSFHMGVTEVTQEQYAAVMGKNPSEFKGAKNPVETVSWDDAVAFCGCLSERSGRKVRLPTEAEWEYACRAGTCTPFHTGQTLSRAMANYYIGCLFPSNRKGKSRPALLPGGSFKSNSWGLCDMHGSVFEWCRDWYGDFPGGQARDPQGPDSGESRMLRGGSWFSGPQVCRSACRSHGASDLRYYGIGFRCVQDSP